MIVKTEFKVVVVSDNRNSFGLKQCILIAKDGTTFKVCANDLNIPNKDDIINVNTVVIPELNGKPVDYCFAELGFEIPEKVTPNPPKEVIEELWPDQN